jgi:hypothetical protein
MDPEIGIALMKPRFCYRLGRLLQACMEAGHDVQLVEGYRTPARQKYLYSIGRTIDLGKPVVTEVKSGMHQIGCAMDVCSPTLGYAAPALFDWLRVNAPRFGLRTLPGDRGHIEEEI